MPLAAWIAFGQMCKRRRMTRARHLFDLMWADIKRHGTDEEKEAFTAGDQELRRRRSRRREPRAIQLRQGAGADLAPRAATEQPSDLSERHGD